jgi:general secretion pathway protein G
MRRFKRRNNAMKKGFTLVELMLVVIIIGVLAAMIVPRMAGRSEEARASVAQADIMSISTALRLYELDNGAFPTTSEGLEALLEKPSSARNWKGPYLERKPVDPWGQPYAYRSPAQYSRAGFDLYSIGRDALEGTEDDIINWDKS